MHGDAELLQVIQLSCVRQQKAVFTNISFTLDPGEALIVEGENGAGKSSLLRLLAGLSTPFTGNILWKNDPICSLRQEYTALLHYIGHTNGLKPHLSPIENLQLYAHLFSSSQRLRPEWETQLSTVLQLCGLENVARNPAKYLSAGQQRRIALAKCFLLPKKIWILDEPLAALDASMQAIFLTQLATHLRQGGIAIISSHDEIAFPKERPRSCIQATLRLELGPLKKLGLPAC
jgi:heme exporter protein A